NLTGSFVDDGYLQLVQFLGCGTFAKVYKAIDTTSPAEDPAYFAVKCMKNDVAGSRRLAAMENEFQTHAAVDYQEGVVSFHRVFIEGEFVFVVLDLCESDMHSGVLDGRRYAANPAIAKAAFIELLDAVEECHQAGVYHRDLKPANILCDSVGTGIRLADFGVATWKEESCQFAIGSPGYISPGSCLGLDRTRGSYSSSQSDAWALAVIFVNITTGNIPWGMATLKDPRYAAFRADPENRLRKSHNLTHEANDILKWCFHVDPERRPTIAQLRAAVLATE
ncbi:kinase-like domain-containing protein, partial [Mycena galericulata]